MACVCVTVLVATSAALALTAGQTDDFQDGTTQGWGSGLFNPNPPVNVPNGGPLGAGDKYLQITATGVLSGAGGKLVAFNSAQWSGDYTSTNLALISADLNNFSPSPLTMRLAIDGPGGRFSSTVGLPLPATSGWVSAQFPIAPSDFTSVGGLDINATLSNVTVLRILHNPGLSFNGGAIAATIGADNTRAVPMGDVNGDGFVGGDDLSIILTNWGQSIASRGQGDLSGDGFVGGDDYSEVLTYWGSGTAPEAIPEPATLGLFLLAGAALAGKLAHFPDVPHQRKVRPLVHTELPQVHIVGLGHDLPDRVRPVPAAAEPLKQIIDRIGAASPSYLLSDLMAIKEPVILKMCLCKAAAASRVVPSGLSATTIRARALPYLTTSRITAPPALASHSPSTALARSPKSTTGRNNRQ